MNKNNEDLLNVDENLEDNSSNKKEEASSEQEIKSEHNFENNENNSTKEFENKISELNDKLLRSLAENQNLRKIHEKEKEDLIKYSSTSFARESLNLADNLERAFLLFKENPKFKSEEFKDIGIGMELIEKELRYIDPRKLRKVREIKKKKDERTGVDIMDVINEYYIYNDKVTTGASSNFGPVGVRITTDSIISVVSGLMDSRRAVVLSYLHKAIKPLNQLRMIEDATVIYRISRAPERRIFYIDVGNLPKLKAEQYLRDIMVKYKNKLVYDANTGEVRDDRKFLSMMEDFWLPRREGGKGTEITTLPGGQNLGELEDVKYFERKLYKSLSVPISRLEPNQGFSLGRVSEVTRDELKFSKFVDRLRNKFSDVFDQALRAQCVLKGICTSDEWAMFKEHIYYNFIKDNNFTELKDAELMRERLSLLTEIDPYTGRYFSQKWIQKNVLRLDDNSIAKMQKEIDKEKEEGLGLPVQVMNGVAGQIMASDVPQQPQHPDDVEADQAAADQEQKATLAAAKAKTKSEETTFGKLKRIL